jgi:hypothetical protein
LTPNEHLAHYSRVYPDIWKQADFLRDGRDNPDYQYWPGWCFLPISGWNAVLNVEPDNFTPENMALATDAAVLAALGAWRYTQGIYRFHPQLYDALVNTPHSGDMPIEVLMRLPEWCVYIEVPQEFVNTELPVIGFFAYLEYDKFPELRFVVNVAATDVLHLPAGTSGDFLYRLPPIFLRQYSVVDALKELTNKEIGNVVVARLPIPSADEFETELSIFSEALSKYLSIVLYLCSEEPQIDGDSVNDGPKHPTPTKTKKGLRLFPPPKPRIWKVGEEIGEVLEKAEREYAERTPRQPGEPIPRRAHIRRAHWHTFWRGPRKPDPNMPEEMQKPYKTIRWMRLLEVGTGRG